MRIDESNQQQIDFDKQQGLVPAIVQHALTGTVLMQGYMNAEAVQATLDEQRVTFFSRSKQRLWCKGESSGHHLQLVSLHTDCDQDSLLALALPQGPTCHLGTESCFSATDFSEQPLLNQLMRIVQSRSANPEGSSYTERLLAEGSKRAAQKVGEEGVETALAAVADDREELLNESADLLYHLLVLLRSKDLELSDVLTILHQRRR
ncbi:bifunctional phosphoribosyl-AMP cyclohydrolase/phosphoribosyl-ATP diphosphatase HisIE [Pseudidiomarina terrestris]|uniref:Histidine biosynthesis bifunctional protein HisIE n=1 Tax=Pseudidiomarina terrestris TaxID=2820060 RepID=A0AAW7QYN1_9GAMM|nr:MULTISPECIES: bifunctional phosphoribosyl-AMP cyclohydrolase/phosphoribosyl-ATP diphosphatase HisIE [unclassified Pseudidiomarina]MDN7123409.1 bifunctional phosphoribosyl-AMP cyclohydrolase/phosphoribosyl-ATP diphosphatase HisIE [Pseudidiomarina sp. 1APP75-32.1]MDN7134871.1 bifunctional phosphoribosyl-AMP cyclohydrolase/phosphoribosyl-ATP diphosphatase HisIE [Pseudidiomarina sp. 1ASP75-5]MEA3587341.1 bifunctional phosphoribosyl-AMP cyclohydrolase/phosphoribosyl-ATP diphosphatase HisIE [Pseudi